MQLITADDVSVVSSKDTSSTAAMLVEPQQQQQQVVQPQQQQQNQILCGKQGCPKMLRKGDLHIFCAEHSDCTVNEVS